MSIYLRGNVWYSDIYVNGRRVRRRLSDDAEEARAMLREMKQQRDWQRWHLITPQLAVREVIQVYLRRAKATCRASTLNRYEYQLNHFEGFCKAVGVTHVSGLTLQLADDYVLWRKEQGAAPNTINQELIMVRAALAYAVRLGRLESNPWERIEKLKVSDKSPRVFTREEIRAITDTMPTWAADAVTLLTYTGMRVGELQHLTWRDVDLQRETITITSRAVQTKTGHSWLVPLAGPALEILRRRSEARDRRACIIWTERGPFHRNSLREMFQRRLRGLGLEHGTIHDLRHTFASWMIEAGASLDTVQAILGHRTYKTTERYKHLSPGFLKGEVDRLT